jgi:rare lipoprotein A
MVHGIIAAKKLSKSTRLGVSALAASAILAGCAETRVVATSAKQVNIAQDDLDTSGKVYKVGKPYKVAGKWYYPSEDYGYTETGYASWYGPNFHGKPTAIGERFDMYQLSAAHKTLPLPSIVRVTNLENGRTLKLRVNDRGPFVGNRIIDVSKRGAQLLGFEKQGTAKVRVEVLAEESIALKNNILSGSSPASSPARITKRDNTNIPKPINQPVQKVDLAPIAPVQASVSAGPVNLGAKVEPPKAVISGPIVKDGVVQAPVVKATPAKVTTSQQVSPQIATKTTPTATPPESPHVVVQLGAFSDKMNADKLVRQISAIGKAYIVPVEVNGRTLYRVRLGPYATAAQAAQTLAAVNKTGIVNARILTVK